MTMPKSTQQISLQTLTTHDEIIAPLWLSFRHDPAHSLYPVHGHAWAEFIYAFDGIMEVKIDQVDYITPPPYGIWLPPHIQHSGLNRTAVSHGTLYVHESLCAKLPKNAGILLTSPLVSALFEHLKNHQEQLNIEEQQRLLHVLLDQLHHAKLMNSYLPTSQHPSLGPVLKHLHQHPADNRALHAFALLSNRSERSLARLCQKELGMSLHEWRQRLRVIKAMSLLHQNRTVESIALDLGYASASAFIQVFKRWMHTTPDQFRKQHVQS
jgi:AraC-like DNA-binding protein